MSHKVGMTNTLGKVLDSTITLQAYVVLQSKKSAETHFELQRKEDDCSPKFQNWQVSL